MRALNAQQHRLGSRRGRRPGFLNESGSDHKLESRFGRSSETQVSGQGFQVSKSGRPKFPRHLPAFEMVYAAPPTAEHFIGLRRSLLADAPRRVGSTPSISAGISLSATSGRAARPAN